MMKPIKHSPTLRFLENLAVRFLARRGNVAMPVEHFRAAEIFARDAVRFVERSGHLNTVSGRKPHAIKKLKTKLNAVRGTLRPALVDHTRPPGRSGVRPVRPYPKTKVSHG